MQVRDISVKKRLFFANFMMVFIPVCLLALIGAAAFAGLRFTGAAQQRELSLLWPEKGPALSVQFAVSSLRVKAEKKGGPKLHEMMEDFQLLEAQGINTMVLRDGQVSYMTPGADPVQLQAAVREMGQADLLIIGGTSLVVYPAAGLVRYYRGHKLVVINKTPLDRGLGADLVITGAVGETLAQL